MKTRLFAAILLTLLASMGLCAATLDDARSLIAQGKLLQARTTLDSLSRQLPKNAEVDMLLAEVATTMGNDATAQTHWENARRKGNHEATLALADLATRQYRLDDAETLLAAYRKALRSNRRLKDNSGDLDDRIDRTREMLDRVASIVVIDSIVVDKDRFFEAYRLAPEAGKIEAATALPAPLSGAPGSTVYTTEDGREMIWAEMQDDALALRFSNLLNDGTWEEAQPVGEHLGGGGNAAFPFLMADGITLYYAADGEDSLGGYDIYISRNNGEEFLQPQNMGMPYNSPYDDYLLAIDETTGAGWWATDRNRIPGKLTVYVFIPAELRVNLPVDDPNLASRALLTSIRDTWEPGSDYSSLRSAIAAIKEEVGRADSGVALALPDGRIITEASQLANRGARDTFGRYAKLSRNADADAARLQDLRRRYADGDTSTANEIRSLEQRLENAKTTLRRTANDVIRAEMPQTL